MAEKLEVRLVANETNGFVIGVVFGLAAVGLSTVLIKLTSNYVGSKSYSSSAVTKYQHYSSKEKDSDEEIEVAPDRDAFWFKEPVSPFMNYQMSLTRILFEGRSSFQRVQVIETKQFGKTLVMDGQTQSAERDEKIYHESLVHPAMLLHPNPRKVFIGGGGEFATAREVLKHKSVEKCIMVDIDKLACDICREQLPEWNDGAYEDKRFQVFYEDAKKWLEDTDMVFDVIILDICDPIEAGPGYLLYTEEFYRFLNSKLSKNGIVVTQSGPGAVYNVKEECFTAINSTLRSAFDRVLPYTVDVPSFGCTWGFNLASNGNVGNVKEILDTKTVELDARISERISKELYFLHGASFKGLFGIAKSIQRDCLEEKRTITIDNPIFMYTG